jgi:carboxyl-terminal processing protease
MPIVVLIDYGSASASEIVAGSIQDLDRGVIIGQQSYGKGLVQNVIPLNYNTKLKITVAKYYIPSGRCIQAIDYSNRDSLGRVINTKDVPKNIFYTKNKRPVYDAGGIIPDVTIEPEMFAKITISLIIKRLMFDFATYYAHKNTEILNPTEFKITNEIYNEFKEFIKDKEYDYTTESEEKLKELKEITKEEKYYDSIESEYESLMTKITHNKQEDLETFREEISEYLANEIISRYYFQKGRIEHSLTIDEEISKAKKVIKDIGEYNRILTDTSEKE